MKKYEKPYIEKIDFTIEDNTNANALTSGVVKNGAMPEGIGSNSINNVFNY